jgi:hypothetical protein
VRAALLGFIDDTHAAFKYFSHDLIAKFILDGEQSHAAMLENRGGKSSPALQGSGRKADFNGKKMQFMLAPPA